MLIARAPVRISFGGGGTDLPAYYERFGGKVVSAAINRYFYVMATVNDEHDVQITSSDYRIFYQHRKGSKFFWEGDDLSLPKAILDAFAINSGLALFCASEVPPGTGLGSSSSVAVAIIKAVTTLQGRKLSKQELAERACQIEIEKLGMPIGKQDQYAAAFGGLNSIVFTREGVTVTPLALDPEVVSALERRLMLFFTGSARNSKHILAEQRQRTEEPEGPALAALHRIRQVADEVEALLTRGDLDGIGAMLHESWLSKKQLAKNVSNAKIDTLYEAARANGALGGKITGAGGGGFLMVYAHEEKRDAITTALERLGVTRMDFRFDTGGARVLLNAGRFLPDARLELRAGATA